MTALAVPSRLDKRPRHKGHVVPFFVAWIDGTPDFRIVDPERLRDCLRFRQCWLCGGPLGSRGTFVIGPMCAVNRTSAEPPSHRDCAEYAVRACPFLIAPKMTRRETNLPGEVVAPAGQMIRRNPGVTLTWTTRKWSTWTPDGRGLLFDIGEPESTGWWTEGRPSTRDEVLVSIASGLPILRAEAKAEGRGALTQLDRMVRDAMRFVPVKPVVAVPS